MDKQTNKQIAIRISFVYLIHCSVLSLIIFNTAIIHSDNGTAARLRSRLLVSAADQRSESESIGGDSVASKWHLFATV